MPDRNTKAMRLSEKDLDFLGPSRKFRKGEETAEFHLRALSPIQERQLLRMMGL